jgi:hypothetical protein
MKEKLIEILQLPATASEADIIAAASVLAQKANAGISSADHENQIQKIMKEGGGAISREIAQEILDSRNQ